MKRYAIYYAPEAGSSLWRFGSDWLGWDAEAGQACDPGPVHAERERITEAPRRYGFHGTLKPPFRLAGGCDAAGLEAALRDLAGTIAPFAAPPLVPVVEHGFLSLRPSAPCPAQDALAAACVARLDGFRAPPEAAELARRRKGGLTPAQEALLDRWGYPYVMEEFRFHLTLTGFIGDAAAAAVRDALAGRLGPLCRDPLPMREICLFGEPEAGHFRLLTRVPLTG